MNLSTMTKIQVAEPDRGKPSTKSIEIVCQALSGTDRGCNSPRAFVLSGLACWHVIQA
jgi:hypothetical protein